MKARILALAQRQHFHSQLYTQFQTKLRLFPLTGWLLSLLLFSGGAMWFYRHSAAAAPRPAFACTVVNNIAPNVGIPGATLTLTGAGLDAVTAVKFTNNVNATFTLVNETQLTVVIPAGAVTGPLTVSKPDCADVQTQIVSICANPPASLVVDDGSAELGFAGASNGLNYFVNRLTPPSYPATLTAISLRLEASQNVPAGTAITVIAGANPDGDNDINNTPLQLLTAQAGASGQFTTYNLSSPVTINAGDFVIGFSLNQTAGQLPGALDTNGPPNARSYHSTNGTSYSLIERTVSGVTTNPNLLIRGVYATNCTAQPVPSPTPTPAFCHTASAISPTRGSVGAPVRITGNNLTGVTSVRFANNSSAQFTVDSNTQITAIVTEGSTSGPIFLSKPGCPDIFVSEFVVVPCDYTIAPTNQNFAATGGSGTITVTTGGDCYWTASSNVPWVTLTSSGIRQSNGSVSFTVTANTGQARSGAITVAGKVFTVNQAAGCSFTISPTTQNFQPAGGTGTVNVTTTSECAWTATSNASWLTINSGATGQGNGSVGFTVATHNGPARTGSLTIAGQTFTVNQLNGCTFTIAPTTQSFTAAGGNGTVNVTAGTGCAWSATSNASWLTINTGASGNGNGAVTFTAAANPGLARTGTMVVAGQTFTVTQSSGCLFTINPTSRDFTAAGGTGTVAVTTGTGCTWTATSNASWLTINSGTPGSGDGTVTFTVAANSGTPRSGTLTVAGQTFTVNQLAGCSYTLTLTTPNFAALGGTGTVNVAAATGCAWTAVSSASWLTLNGSTSGNGNGAVAFSVATNLGAARSATITIGGQVATINQAAASTALACVSAASFTANELAVESIVACFGSALTAGSAVAQTTPLPTTLAGTVVRIKDSANVERPAPLFFVSPSQINLQIPPDSAPGLATVTVIGGNGAITLSTLTVAPVAPALFTANANGRDVPAGIAVRVRNGVQTVEPLSTLDASINRFVAVPLDLGPATDTVVVALFGTGFRFRSGLDQVQVRIGVEGATPGPVNADVSFAGPAPGFAGLDQLNFVLPRALAGRGLTDLRLTVNGKVANVVKINIK